MKFFLVFGCYEFDNRYLLLDQYGSQLFYLKEDSTVCMRCFCKNARELSLSFQDNAGSEVLRFERPLRCMECCCNSFYPNMTQVYKQTIIVKRTIQYNLSPNFLSAS